MPEKKAILSRLLLSLALLAVGASAGWFFARTDAPVEKPDADIRLAKFHPPYAADYKYVNPLLGCTIMSGTKSYFEEVGLESRLKDILKERKNAGDIDAASVYFRGLETGRIADVNENETYEPASLFKVPIMIAYFKSAERDPSVLQQEVVIERGTFNDSPQEIPPTRTVEYGKTYTVEELIKNMIAYSDNRSTSALNQLASDDERASYVSTLSDLSVTTSADGKSGITARGFSTFFRVLYNGTYLDVGMSEKALSYLAASEFDRGLRAGVPPDVTIAKKFGESGTTRDGGVVTRELHDCGIVYAKREPYVLCVMTRGKELDGLEKAIGAVSAAVYDEELKR